MLKGDPLTIECNREILARYAAKTDYLRVSPQTVEMWNRATAEMWNKTGSSFLTRGEGCEYVSRCGLMLRTLVPSAPTSRLQILS